MKICWHCLLAIESREGPQSSRIIYVDENDDEESRCEWCEESGNDALYEI